MPASGRTLPAQSITEAPEGDDFGAIQTSASFDAVALAEELREGVLVLLAAHSGDSDYYRQVLDSFARVQERLAGIEGGDLIVNALRPAAEAAAEAHRATPAGDEATDAP